MSEGTYEFDPCSIDGSDMGDIDNVDFEEENDEGEITLDSWKPREKKKKKTIIQSAWRNNQIGDNYDQQPGIDDLNKIYNYLKEEHHDFEIMRVFGLDSTTLAAIKKHKYCPVDGIKSDNLSKIYKEFNSIESRIKKLQYIIDDIAAKLITTDVPLKDYQALYNDNHLKEKTEKEIKSEALQKAIAEVKGELRLELMAIEKIDREKKRKEKELKLRELALLQDKKKREKLEESRRKKEERLIISAANTIPTVKTSVKPAVTKRVKETKDSDSKLKDK